MCYVYEALNQHIFTKAISDRKNQAVLWDLYVASGRQACSQV